MKMHISRYLQPSTLMIPLLACGLLTACFDDSPSAGGSTSTATLATATSSGASSGDSGDATTEATSSGGDSTTTSSETTSSTASTGPSTTGTTGEGGESSTTGTTGTTGDTGDTSTTGDPGIEVNFFYGFFMYKNYLAEMEGHSNIALGPTSIPYIQEAKSRGMKPLVWIATAVDLWKVVGDHLELRDDYLQLWNAYAATIAPYADDIYGFYPVDEPFWGSKLSVQDQNALNLAIKASFPGKPILTTFARPTIDAANFVVPETYDIVGYDNYYGASFESDYTHYEVLKSKLSPGQKMFLIGDGFTTNSAIPDAIQQLKAQKIYQAYELARTPGEPLVGILTYVWDGFHEDWPLDTGEFFPGVRAMPLAKEHFIQVGKVALAEQ